MWSICIGYTLYLAAGLRVKGLRIHGFLLNAWLSITWNWLHLIQHGTINYCCVELLLCYLPLMSPWFTLIGVSSVLLSHHYIILKCWCNLAPPGLTVYCIAPQHWSQRRSHYTPGHQHNRKEMYSTQHITYYNVGFTNRVTPIVWSFNQQSTHNNNNLCRFRCRFFCLYVFVSRTGMCFSVSSDLGVLLGIINAVPPE